MSPSNIVNFPKKFRPPPAPAEPAAQRRRTQGEQTTPAKYHDEIFEYEDGSYVVLVQPKKEKFTVERMVFMAERLKMTLFDVLPFYEDLALEPGPDDAS